MLLGLIQSIVLKDKPHIIHSNHLSIRSLVASIVGKKFNIPVIITCHGYDTEVPPNLYEYLLRRSVVVNADRIIVLTDARRELLSKVYSETEKFVIIPNFIHCEDIVHVNNQIELEKLKIIARKQVGVSPNKVVLLYLGRIIKEKGVFDILNAVKEIQN